MTSKKHLDDQARAEACTGCAVLWGGPTPTLRACARIPQAPRTLATHSRWLPLPRERGTRATWSVTVPIPPSPHRRARQPVTPRGVHRRLAPAYRYETLVQVVPQSWSEGPGRAVAQFQPPALSGFRHPLSGQCPFDRGLSPSSQLRFAPGEPDRIPPVPGAAPGGRLCGWDSGGRSPTRQRAVSAVTAAWSLARCKGVTCGRRTVPGAGGAGEMVTIRTVELGGCY